MTSWSNIRWGLSYGLIFAVVYSGTAAAAFWATETDYALLWPILGGYFAAGILTGLLLGIARDKITSRKRSVILGMIIAYPAALIMIFLSQDDPLPLDALDFVGAGFMAVTLGGWAGWYFGRSNEAD